MILWTSDLITRAGRQDQKGPVSTDSSALDCHDALLGDSSPVLVAASYSVAALISSQRMRSGRSLYSRFM